MQSNTQAPKTTKLMKPTSNILQISAKRDSGFYVFLSKLFLLDFNDIELHALGDAIPTAVKVAELLNRHEYTLYEKIETTTIVPQEDAKDDRPKRGKKAKLIVKLKKSSKFDTLIKNFRIQKS